MAEQTRETLKSYFETGDYPTQANFADLIDSAYNKVDDDMGGGEVLTKSFKYVKRGNLSASIGTDKLYIPVNMNIHEVELTVNNPNDGAVTFNVPINGDGNNYVVWDGTGDNGRYRKRIINKNLNVGDYITVNWEDTTLAENASITFYYTVI